MSMASTLTSLMRAMGTGAMTLETTYSDLAPLLTRDSSLASKLREDFFRSSDFCFFLTYTCDLLVPLDSVGDWTALV